MSSNDIILIAVGALVVVLAGTCAQAWRLRPAPLLARRSLRVQAMGQLGVRQRTRLRRWAAPRLARLSHPALIAALAALALVPRWRIGFGPFGHHDESSAFLNSTWQVLGAAVGVSVALIAFVLEAFMTSGERRFGGTLREFVSQTHLLWLFDIAAAALLLDGIVLASAGHGAPGGWPGLVAAVLSGLTLAGLLTVVPRTILAVLDPARLWSMRTEASQRLARSAVEMQLVGQLASQTLHDSQQQTNVSVNPLGSRSDDFHVVAGSAGVVADIRLGPLWRATRRLGLLGEQRLEVLTEIGRTVRPDTRIVALPHSAKPITRRKIRRAIRIAGRAAAPEQQLMEALERLRQQGMDAVRRGDDAEWRDLAELLEEQLLELPRRTAELGLAFDGAVSKPGLFGRGPSRRILDVLADVRDEAARREQRSIINNIMHLPHSVCRSAENWDAPDLVGQCTMFYPESYVAADRPGLQSSGMADHLRQGAVDQLFETLQYGPASTIAYDEVDDQHLLRAADHLLRGLHAVRELFRAIIRRGDGNGFDLAYRALTELYEHWESWETGRRTAVQQQLLADLDAMRLALAGWAVHHLEGADHDPTRQRTARGFAVRLLSDVGSDELLLALDALTDHRQRIGGDDIAWWYFDERGERVQTISAESQLARAVIFGLWIRAVAGQLKVTDAAPIGYHAEALQEAVERLREHQVRYQPADDGDRPAGDKDDAAFDGHPLPVEALDQVSAAIVARQEREQDIERQKVRDDEPDLVKVAQLIASISSAAEKTRRLPSALPGTRIETVEISSLPERRVKRLIDKRYLLDRPGFGDPKMLGEQIGRSVGVAEIADLVSALKPIPTHRTDHLRDAVRDAIAQLRDAGHRPDAILAPGQGDLVDGLDAQFGVVQGPFGGRAAPIVDGVPIIYRPDLEDRLLIVSLDALRLRQAAAQGGVQATVTAINEQMAIELYDAGTAMPDEDRDSAVAALREKALVEVRRCWELNIDADGHRAVGPPATRPASEPAGETAST